MPDRCGDGVSRSSSRGGGGDGGVVDAPLDAVHVRGHANRKNAAAKNGKPHEIGEWLEKNVANMLGRMAKHEAWSGVWRCRRHRGGCRNGAMHRV